MLTIATHVLSGVFAINALPHLLAGLQGRAFPSPFATPPGRGLSSPRITALWGAINAALAWGFAVLITPLDLTAWPDALAFFAGGFATLMLVSGYFAKVLSARGGGDVKNIE